jgi:nucleoside-diphosphate-sugar epimerase
MITVLGASGFIGGHVVDELGRLGLAYAAPDRHERLDGRELGDVVYCAGVNTDLRRRPLDTVAAHVGYLEHTLRTAELRSLVYLSSTRVYRSPGAATEDDVLEVDPSDPERLYDTSKALGEALSLASGVPALVLRLANVYGLSLGSANFLSSILQDALGGQVILRTSLDSTRNYVGIADVVSSLVALLRGAAQGIYNIAGERAVSHREVADALAGLTGCAVAVVDGAPTETAPDISIARVAAAIDYAPESVLDALPRLVDGYRNGLPGE